MFIGSLMFFTIQELIAASLQGMNIGLGCAVILAMSLGAGVIVHAIHTHFADKKVQWALHEERMRERYQQMTKETLARAHKEEVQLRMSFVWEALFEFQYTLFGTTKEAEADAWNKYVQYGHTMPPLHLPEQHQAFHNELATLMKLLMHVGTMVDGGRIQLCDLDAFEERVHELRDRFRQFKRTRQEQDCERYNVLFDLEELQDAHSRLAKRYCLTRTNCAFHHFRGTTHALEVMVEDKIVPVQYAQAYVIVLRKQLSLLKTQYEEEIIL